MRLTRARRLSVAFAAAILLVFALPAVGDVDNGGFETPEVTDPAGWDIFTSSEIGDWTVEWAGNYAGAPSDAFLELHAGVNGWLPNSGVLGEQYAELDTDWDGPGSPGGEQASVSLSQDVDVLDGYNYELSYFWSPRPGHDNNAIDVEVDGSTIASHSASGAANSNTDWAGESYAVAASGTTMTVTFTETGTPDSLGMFLDDVSCEFCVSTTTSDLVYGRQNVDVGDVTVTHDDEYIYVEFDVDDPWVLFKTHVEIAEEPGDFPQNNGGLIPGQFTYGSGPYVPGVQNDTLMIPIPDFIDGPDEYYVAFHAELLEISSAGYYWATEVLASNQGLRYDGSAVLANRSITSDVLGAPDGVTTGGGDGFFSLGFGGSITVGFDGYIYNSNSPYEFAGVEITGGNSYPAETAKVEFLYDGEWYLAGTELSNQPVNGGDPKTFTYVQLPDGIPYAEQVRITDTSVKADFESLPGVNETDGFDLDAVKARKLVLSEETGWADTEGVTVGKNWSMYFPFDFNCPIEEE